MIGDALKLFAGVWCCRRVWMREDEEGYWWGFGDRPALELVVQVGFNG